MTNTTPSKALARPDWIRSPAYGSRRDLERTYLKIPLKSQDGRIDRLVCKLWESVQALEESCNVFSELSHLFWKFLSVQISRDDGGRDIQWRFRSMTLRPRSSVVHLGGRVLMADLSREQVRGILVEEMEDPCHPLTEVVDREKDPDRTSELRGSVGKAA